MIIIFDDDFFAKKFSAPEKQCFRACSQNCLFKLKPYGCKNLHELPCNSYSSPLAKCEQLSLPSFRVVYYKHFYRELPKPFILPASN